MLTCKQIQALINPKLISKIYFIFLGAIIYIPQIYDVIDIKATHWFYLGLINTLFLIYIFFTDKLVDYSFLKNKYLLSFCVLFLISCLSVSVSINIAESIMKLTDIFNILISIIIVLYISYKRYVNVKFLLYIILSTLLIDLLVSYTQYYNILSIEIFHFRIQMILRFLR